MESAEPAILRRRERTASLPAFATASLLALTATCLGCATADGDVAGGDPRGFDMTPPAFTPDTTPCTSEGAGARWSDLYRDLFGPTGRTGSCTFSAGCHQRTGNAAAKLAFQCYDQSGCYQSLVDGGWIKPTDSAAPDESSFLKALLRLQKADGTVIGFMPKEPICVYPEPALARIRTWIRDGAKNE